MGMLRADGGAGLQPLAETLLQDAEREPDALLVAVNHFQVAQSHAFLRGWTSGGP